MSRTVMTKTVGAFVFDESEGDDNAFYYEEAYGSSPYGDVGLYYRNMEEDKPKRGVCYIAEVPQGRLYLSDPKFRDYAYTYDEVLNICKGDKAVAELVLELAIGQSIEAIYDEVKDAKDED